jgi:hypothetical protein
MKRMTPSDAFNSQPTTLYNTMFFNSLIAVMRTGGVKTAGGRKERRKKSLVKMN